MAEHLDQDELDRERVSAIALAADQTGLVPRRLGAVRPRRDVRRHDAAAPPRRGPRQAQSCLSFPRQARDPGADPGRRRGARRQRCGACSSSGARVSSGTSGRASFYNLTSKPLNDYVKIYLGRGVHARRTSGPGAGRSSRRSALAERAGREGFPETETEQKRSVTAVMRRVAERARKYAGVCARVVRLACGHRAVSRRANDRGFPPAAFARRRRTRGRLSPEEQALLSLLPFVANSPGTRGCLTRSEFL